MSLMYREMQPSDYVPVYALWEAAEGVGLDPLADSEQAIHRYLLRNPGLSQVATCERRIVDLECHRHCRLINR